MSPGPRGSTRSRLIAESMRLFGEQGYSGTSVSEIEAAAGLSGGSGSLYRHFASKEALLSEGIREQVAAGKGLLGLVRDAGTAVEAPLRESLAMIAVAGLRRLEQERDHAQALGCGRRGGRGRTRWAWRCGRRPRGARPRRR